MTGKVLRMTKVGLRMTGKVLRMTEGDRRGMAFVLGVLVIRIRNFEII